MQRSQFPHLFVGCDPYELHVYELRSYQNQSIVPCHPLPKYLGLMQRQHQLLPLRQSKILWQTSCRCNVVYQFLLVSHVNILLLNS